VECVAGPALWVCAEEAMPGRRSGCIILRKSPGPDAMPCKAGSRRRQRRAIHENVEKRASRSRSSTEPARMRAGGSGWILFLSAEEALE
jgi:hypothetical protein